MASQLAITARNLGSLTLAKYCPRCLFYLERMRFHPPFDSFGAGIFNAMERCERAVLNWHMTKGSIPKHFAPFCDIVERAEFPRHWSKFRYDHESGIVLYGAPDDIFVLSDGSLCVIDYKTAKAKGNDDPFHSQYEIQVIGYANIAEIGLDLGTVSRGGLLYWEIQTEDVETGTGDHLDKNILYVPFKPTPLEIEIDYEKLDPLIAEAKRIWKLTSPPEGADNCSDCKKLDLLFAIEQQIENEDARLLSAYAFQDTRDRTLSRVLGRRNRRASALRELLEAEDFDFASDGLTANWEFLQDGISY